MLYVTGISGSNDTTGKDCVRYGFRQNFYGETAANAIGPVLVKTYRQEQEGRVHDAGLHLRSHRHQIGERLSDQERRLDAGDQPGLSTRHARTSAQYLTNIANSGADVIVNVNWGRDAVLSIQQAKQFGVYAKMKMVIPYQIPFLAQETGRSSLPASMPPPTSGGRWKTSIRWPRCSSRRSTRSTATSPEWGANNAYMSFAIWARMVSEAGTFYPPDVIKSYEKGEKFQSTVGEVYFRKEDHQLVRPVIIVKGKAPKEMKNKEDYWEVARGRAGRAVDAEARRVRLQSRRLHLSLRHSLFRSFPRTRESRQTIQLRAYCPGPRFCGNERSELPSFLSTRD